MMRRSIIVAKADNGAIGVGGDLPWHISEDLKFFKRTTLGCPVIMGRTTFESIGRKPLPGRLNIVLTRNVDILVPEGVVLASSLEDAYAIAGRSECEQYFVIGGASVYKAALSDANYLYITEVHTVIPDADAFFPSIDPQIWKEVSRSQTFTDPKTGYNFEFVEYSR